MNRRRFLGVVAAVLAAPITIAKGWFVSKRAFDLSPLQLDALKELREAAETCLSCYCEQSEKYISHYYQLVGQPRRPSFIHLCDTCAEKLGYLCKRRNWPHVDVFDDPDWRSCYCGKRGCPGNDVKWSNKVNPYKPPTSEDINLIVEKRRKNAVLEINQRTEQYLYGKAPV